MSNGTIKDKINPFTFLLFILASVFIISPLFQHGLFIDGLLYKTVSTNYFWGDSSFWNMKFNDITMNPFYEQPPLFFFVTGSFYKIFGNSFLADKFLTLIFIAVSVFFIFKICKIIFKEIAAIHLTVFLLLTIPVLCWTYVNQVIETLVLPLTLGAFYMFLSFRKKEILWKRLIYVLLFSLLVVLLFLTKGFQSCFIVLGPLLYFIFFRERSALFFWLITAIIISGTLYFILFIHEPSALWFSNYLQKRLMASLSDVGATTSYRAEIIVRTFTELIVPLLVAALAFIFYKIKNKIPAIKNSEEKKTAWILLIIALSGSIPFAVTLEQRGFYLVPSFPFFIMAIILFFEEPLLNFYTAAISFLEGRFMKPLLLILFLASPGYIIVSPGLYKRDENLLKDLELISARIQPKDTVSVDPDSWNDTALQAYLYMQNKTNVEANYLHGFYIHDRSHNTVPNDDYQKINIATKQYDLYVKKEPR